MHIQFLIEDMSGTLEKICNTKEEFNGVILGHENCHIFIDSWILIK